MSIIPYRGVAASQASTSSLGFSSSARRETDLPAPPSLQGFDLSEIRAIDLTQFRSSNLPSTSYFLLLLPVIGWIALACLKCYYVMKHHAAEQIMEGQNFNAKPTVDEKIAVISEAIKVSGPHAWQYRLELARLHLLKGEFRRAANDLAAVKNQRGSPTQTGHYNVRETGLISYQVATGANWVGGRFVMKINYHDGHEALLNAAVFAANQQPVEAYDAYNEVIYYNRLLSHSRQHQGVLVEKMNENPSLLDKRGLDITSAERSHLLDILVSTVQFLVSRSRI